MSRPIPHIIATRTLLFSNIGESELRDLTIRIYAPYLLQEGDVPYDVSEGVASCEVEFEGINGETRAVHGADTVQALEMAVNFEPTLRRLSRRYRFFWPSGEPYFDD